MQRDYAEQKLEWVKYRIEMLDQMEEKLKKMRELAEYARENELTDSEKEEINARLHMLEKEVVELDEKSKKFWLDNQ